MAGNHPDNKFVAVYCSSRSGLQKETERGARKIAETIGKCGATLIYGGVNAGLMHIVAEAAKRKGAEITGVIPEVFRNRADSLCDMLIYSKDLNERKGKMIERADIFVVLPGGIGTLDEWISTLSHIMVEERIKPESDRPILVWNENGMYDNMAGQLRATDTSIFARGKRVDRSELFNEAEDLAARLEELLTKK